MSSISVLPQFSLNIGKAGKPGSKDQVVLVVILLSKEVILFLEILEAAVVV
jgi:hypothetical protein